MANEFVMPSWEEFATNIVRSYVDCERRAVDADAAGEKREAAAFRRLAARTKRLMNKYQITIR